MINTRKQPSTIAVSSQPQQSCVDQSSHFKHLEFKHLDSELELQNKNKRQTVSTISSCARGTLFINRSTIPIILLLLLSSLMVANGKPAEAAASATASAAAISSSDITNGGNKKSIKIIFSDLDGTLIHYPTPNESKNHHHPHNKILELPKSSTGKVGVISSKTLSLVETLRRDRNVKFVLISGMRTSTLLQRLPYLPKADAYCSENGGRIFYPIDAEKQATTNIQGDDATTKRIMEQIDSGDSELDDIFWVQPKAYKHEKVAGSSNTGSNNKAFGIREDKAWRKRMVAAMGGDSIGPYTLQEIYDSIGSTDPTSTSTPLHQRDGLLWDFCRDLIGNHGYVVDTKGYSTCFRINKKQQTLEELKDVKPQDISALLQTPQWAQSTSKKIDSSVNLSCVDFYPSISGKKNCCLYLASRFFADEIDDDFTFVDAEKDTEDDATDTISTPEENFLSKHAVCMCDDDNDLEMALACQHAYLPDIASESMRRTVAEFPTHFTTCFSEKEGDDDAATVVEGTDASDVALSIIWERVSAATASRAEAAVAEPKTKSIAKAATSSVARILRFAKKNFVSVMGLAIAMAVVSNKKESAKRRPRYVPWLRQKPKSAST